MSINSVMVMTDGRAKRIATRAIFFIAGMAMGLWATLVPYAQQRTGAESGELGTLLLCLGAGSLVSMAGAGTLLGRFGCRAVIVTSAALYCLIMPLLALQDDFWLLALSLFVFGMGMGLTDVAMNVQGTLIEQAADQPLMSGFHCLWSIGGITGAAGGALLFRAGISPLGGTLCAIAITALVLLFSFRSLLPFGNQESKSDRPKAKVRPNFRLVLMALMTMLCFMAEGAVIDWSGVFMTHQRGLAVENAGWGFAIFSLTMSALRLTGDAIVSRIGRKRMLVAGGLVGMLGYLIVVLVPDWTFSIAGFALIGIGAANIVPGMITLAGQEKVMPVNMSVALVSTLGYPGVLGGPAVLGWIAHLSSLEFAFSLLAFGFLAIAIGATKLRY